MPVAIVLGVIVNIVIDQRGSLTPAQCRLAMSEMAEIWRDAGVEVISTPAGEPSLRTDASVSLRIVTFSANGTAPREPILGWVAVAPAGTKPVVFVSLPTLRRVITEADVGGIPFKRLTLDLRDALMARAVGRIAAHELGHYWLRRAAHGRKGLMRRSFTARDLTGAWLGPFQVADDERSAAVGEIESLAMRQRARTARATRVREP